MSKLICSSAIDGAISWVLKAENMVADAISQKGEDCPVSFPNTNYYLPVIYSFTGKKMQNLADLKNILAEAKSMLPARPADNVWLPYLGNALDAGVAALFACEVIEACKYIIGPDPVNGIWLGAASDVIMRERGIEFVDGTAPGFAAITGAAPDNATAVKIAKELQQKNLYVFMGGSVNGKQFAEQLEEEGVQLGWETRLVPFGADVSSLIYALGFANRAALSFGGIKPGDYAGNLKYNKNRIFAFVLALGEVTPDKYAAAAGAISYGFPVIADTDIPEILPTGICTYEHVVSNVSYDQMVEKALEVRGCKIKVVKVPIPVPYGPAFEGERIRKENTYAEFGGNKSHAFEFVTSVDSNQINDGEIEIVGPDIDSVEPGTILPLGIWVEVAGRKMQSDFEPILERQIHHMVNGAEGIWHMGQRDIIWTRISKDGFAKGLRLKDYGEIIHAKFLSDYPAIVDKVKVTLITDKAEVEKRLIIARKVYDERNRRLEAMTDESVDTFYSCLLCQSFAPNHVCVITPERLGLCGAYNWLDGKAAYEIDETGPNQPLKKGECLDAKKGIWAGINDYVYVNSHKTVEAFSAYSIMDRPMTSCGCFEAIVAYLPECNGVMVVNREFLGETPVGMTFSTLAGSVGGGQQTPGFIGCGKVFLTSRKFLSAEGGFKRLVWMPKELKEQIGNDLKKRYAEIEMPDLFDNLADETIAVTANDLNNYLKKINHPVIEMDDMSLYIQSAPDQQIPKEKTSAEQTVPAAEIKPVEITADPSSYAAADIESIKKQLIDEIRTSVTKEVVSSIIDVLSQKFLGISAAKTDEDASVKKVEAVKAVAKIQLPSASERISAVKSFAINKEACESPIWTVKLGNTKDEGGTRKKTYNIGGETCMPFHLWEGKMPNRPLVAMEVFDRVGEKYPAILREIYNNVLDNPAEMAKICVEKYGADIISVRLDGTHPERGNKSADDAVALVKSVLKAVDVPLIISGHNNFDKNNEVMKAIAAACAGENLLFNWVEQDNYRTIAGAAIAYGHTIVAQSPIDVNIGKQLNILLTNMDLKPEKIIMDPMTGSIGYGIEYTYSVMERIRLTGLGGDKMLCAPMIVSPGLECARIKEFKATEANFPMWGDLAKRAAIWEFSTATSLLYAGADILIMYHPEAVKALKKTINDLLDAQAQN
ncbi:MAG: acetyl-CoA decarbonylase/synthase complex subunit alpha/beta [Eubacteriales bacterium]